MKTLFIHTLSPRFRDLDPMGHVNNAVYATYLEQTRAAFYESVIKTPLDDVPTVLANLKIEYHSPIEIGEEVCIELRIDDLGTSSLPMIYEIYADGDHAASAETVQVVVNPETGSAMSIPEGWRTSIGAHCGQQS